MPHNALSSPIPEILGTNMVPNETQATAIRHAIQRADDLLLEHADQAVVALVDFKLAHVRLLSAIHSMPPEIIIDIASYAIPAVHVTTLFSWKSDLPSVLSQICQRWRSIILSTPSLWSTIRVDASHSTNMQKCIAQTRTWLERSAELPLALTLYIPDWNINGGFAEQSKPLINLLTAESHRWRVISLDVPILIRRLCIDKVKNHLPMLTAMDLRGPLHQPSFEDTFVDAPLLTQVVFRTDPFARHHYYQIPWQTLLWTTVAPGVDFPAEKTFQVASRLRYCDFRGTDEINGGLPLLNPNVDLLRPEYVSDVTELASTQRQPHSLHTLLTSPNTLLRIARHFQFPNLHRLEIHHLLRRANGWDSPQVLPIFIPFALEVSASLRELVLVNTTMRAKLIVQLLEIFVQLEELTLQDNIGEGDDMLVLRALTVSADSTESVISSKLKHLTIFGTPNFNEDVLADMADSRWRVQANVDLSQLCSVSAAHAGAESPEARMRFSQLRKEGLIVRVIKTEVRSRNQHRRRT